MLFRQIKLNEEQLNKQANALCIDSEINECFCVLLRGTTNLADV